MGPFLGKLETISGAEPTRGEVPHAAFRQDLFWNPLSPLTQGGVEAPRPSKHRGGSFLGKLETKSGQAHAPLSQGGSTGEARAAPLTQGGVEPSNDS